MSTSHGLPHKKTLDPLQKCPTCPKGSQWHGVKGFREGRTSCNICILKGRAESNLVNVKGATL